MKRVSIILGLLFMAFGFINAQQVNWGIDKAHSKIQFDIDHMVISEVSGQFQDYNASITATKDDFSDVKIDLSIQAKSIDTDNEKRDQHLASADFFNAEKYPTITFKSNKLEKVSDNKYKLTGDFTMHGVTKKISLDVKYGGTLKDPWGNTRAGFKVTGTINRTEYGLTYNSVLEAGGVMIGEEVRINCNIELVQQKK